MVNWFTDKCVKYKMVNAIMGELEYLIDNKECNAANYWIDSTHNVFAFINDNGDDDKWIEIHCELYDADQEIIGDLDVFNTEDVSREGLLKEIEAVVNAYYGDVA